MRWALALSIVGCAAAPAVPPTAHELPAIVDPALAPPLRFAPASAPATHYGTEAEPVAPTTLDTAVLEAIAPFAGAARPVVLDGRLSRACGDLAALDTLDDVGELGVELAMQRQGILEPFPELLVVHADPADLAAVTAQLRPKLTPEAFYAPLVRIGVATGPVRDGVAAIVVGIVRSRLATTPIPRQLDAGGEFELAATLHERLATPVLRVTRADGTVEHPPLAPDGAHPYRARVACGPVVGRIAVELTARYPSGPTTVASFPVACGVEPARDLLLERPALATLAGAADRIAALINRDRAAAGLPALRRDAEAERAARDHATASRAGPTRDIPAPPIAGVAYTSIAITSVRFAYEQLANHLSSRALMLSDASTHLGVGFAGDATGGQLTLVYRRVPARIDLGVARRELERRIATWTDTKPHPDLSRAADRMIGALVAGASREDAWFEAQHWFGIHGRGFDRHAFALLLVPDLVHVRAEHLLGTREAHGFGVGIRQADHPTFGRNAIWIVILTGRRGDR